MAKKDEQSIKKQSKPRVHAELRGFEVTINQFGELHSSMNIEKINDFLNRNVDDKKLLEKEEKENQKKKKKK